MEKSLLEASFQQMPKHWKFKNFFRLLHLSVISDKVSEWASRFRQAYVSFLMRYALWFLLIFLTLSTFLTVFSGWYYSSAFSFDPRIGFETRATDLSNKRLAVQQVQAQQVPYQELLIPEILNRKARSARTKRDGLLESGALANGLLGGLPDINSLDNEQKAALAAKFFTTPCIQYAMVGSYIHYQHLEYFSKIIFQVPSLEKLLSLETMGKLCEIDELVDEALFEMNLSGSATKMFPFSFNLPYYIACSDDSQPSKTCQNISEDGLNRFKASLGPCLGNVTEKACTLRYSQQLNKIIFGTQNGVIDETGPVYVAAVLSIVASDGFQFDFHNSVFEKLQRKFKSDDVKLVGAWFNTKSVTFQRYIATDIIFGAVAIFLVILIILVYTSSFLFTVLVSLSLILSVGVAYFVYTAIFGIRFFPFLNLLAIVLIIAVGADDAFLFLYQYRKHIQETSASLVTILSDEDDVSERKGKNAESSLKRLNEGMRESLNEVIAHASIAMFVTSATTAIAFYTNFASNIVVLRSFGLFAGTTMIINYAFVITVLPASIVLLKIGSGCGDKVYKMRSCFECIKRYRDMASELITKIFADCVPRAVQYVRIVAILLTLLLIGLSIYVIVKNPGIRLPEKNSMQLLRSNHPFEWYDENANSYFDFTNSEKRKMNVVVVWGVKPTTTASTIDPNLSGTISINDNFPVTLAHNLQEFAQLLRGVKQLNEPNNTETLWMDKFISWAMNDDRCSQLLGSLAVKNDPSSLSSCLMKFNTNTPIPSMFDMSTAVSDGPIFLKNSNFVGYFIVLPSEYNFSTVFHEMKPFFQYLHSVEAFIGNCSVPEYGGPIVIGPTQVTLLYDLLERILNGTGVSVAISLVVSMVVIAFTTMHLLLSFFAIIAIGLVVLVTLAIVLCLGWTVNVVEATIIVLTIGLSFDYTLHFAVAFKLQGLNNIKSVYSLVSIPVLLAAASSFVAGLALVGARTQAFYEIGSFLMIITVLSLIVALFVFPSFVVTFLKKKTAVKIIKL